MSTTIQTATDPSASIYAALNGAQKEETSKTIDPQDRFLTLLVTQLKNQDPLNPLDNTEMTSQLAQISTVDGIERLNSTLEALIQSSDESKSLQAATLVGHGVLVPGNGLALGSGFALGGFELPEPADKVTITINDANGLAMKTIDYGSAEAGSHSFTWDGKTDDGVAAADGRYTVSVKAMRSGEAVSGDALELGIVNSVVRSGTAVNLNVGTLGMFSFEDVRQII